MYTESKGKQMSELSTLKKTGNYLACVSFSGSVLDAESIRVSVGGENPWRTGLTDFAGRFSFKDIAQFNAAFLPVFEGTPGYALIRTGTPVLYGICEMRKASNLGTEGAHVNGKFLASGEFSQFNDTLSAVPCLRAMKSKARGWKAYLLETDEDIETALCMSECGTPNKRDNFWHVAQRPCGEVFLTNDCSIIDEEDSFIGVILTERSLPVKQSLLVRLSTAGDCANSELATACALALVKDKA